MRSEPVRILYFSSFENFRYGGQRSLYHLVCNLDGKAFVPHVIVPAEGELAERLRARGIAVSPVDLPKIAPAQVLGCRRALRRIRSIIQEGRFDLLHTDGIRNTFYGGIASASTGVPLVWHIRTSVRDPYDRLLYRFSAKLILVADALRRRFDFAAKDGKFVTIYNGVDLDEFRAGIKAPMHLGGLKGRDAEVVLCCAGRVEPMKGQACLAEAVGKILDRHRNLRLLLCGEITDERYRESCEAISRRYGIGDRMRFLGHRGDIADVLSASDIIVLPSVFGEAFPRSVIEAMAMGKPVVATDVGGTREAILEGVTGFIVPPGDAEVLADRIDRLVGNESVRVAMGQAARRRAEELFSIGTNVQATERLYREMMNGDAAGYPGALQGGDAR
jgi:glycosyltransferase involved in cell wall biosynthesis